MTWNLFHLDNLGIGRCIYSVTKHTLFEILSLLFGHKCITGREICALLFIGVFINDILQELKNLNPFCVAY